MLRELSNDIAAAVASAAASVVQVQGGDAPASGLVYSSGVVLTTMAALGREDGLRVRDSEGKTLDAELAGWDPATKLAVLRAAGIEAPAMSPAGGNVRVGEIALGLGRSWSNALTASAGIVAIVGGPLKTGRRTAIDVVFRTTAPMHGGFTGGACLNAEGGLTGIITGASLRGMRVVIPAGIAWTTAAAILEHGVVKQGYIGIAGQPVALPKHQQTETHDRGVLIAAVAPAGPAAQAGLLVGDVLLACNDATIESPQQLTDIVQSTRAGQAISLRVLRAGHPVDVAVTAGERPSG